MKHLICKFTTATVLILGTLLPMQSNAQSFTETTYMGSGYIIGPNGGCSYFYINTTIWEEDYNPGPPPSIAWYPVAYYGYFEINCSFSISSSSNDNTPNYYLTPIIQNGTIVDYVIDQSKTDPTIASTLNNPDVKKQILNDLNSDWQKHKQ